MMDMMAEAVRPAGQEPEHSKVRRPRKMVADTPNQHGT